MAQVIQPDSYLSDYISEVPNIMTLIKSSSTHTFETSGHAH
jgi:hypothetical protein